MAKFNCSRLCLLQHLNWIICRNGRNGFPIKKGNFLKTADIGLSVCCITILLVMIKNGFTLTFKINKLNKMANYDTNSI